MQSPIRLLGLARAALRGAGLGHTDPRDDVRAALLDRFGADDVVLCGSGTDALQVALRCALRASRAGGGAVALPAFTCFDVAAAAVRIADGIALYDVEPDTLAPDPESLERAFARGVRVAVISPLYGIPVDWDVLGEIAARHDAILIEDAAQGHGARWCGTPLGALGALSVLSFGRGKGWTGGKGGAVLLRGRAAVDGKGESWIERDVGLADETLTAITAAAQWALARRGAYAVPAAIPWLGLGETRYHDAGPVRSLTRFATELVRCGAVAAEEEASRRRRNAQGLLEVLRQRLGVRPVRSPDGAEPGYLRLPVRLPGGVAALADPVSARRAGIASSYPTTLAALEPVRHRLMRGRPSRWPGAEELARDLVTLPTHSALSPGDRAAVTDLLVAPAGGRPA